MSLRTSFGFASTTAILLAPPAALIASLLLDGKPLLAEGADNVALLFILMPSYMITLLGFFLIGLPVTVILDKIGGDLMVGSGLALSVLYFLVIGLANADFFSRLAVLTFVFTAGIFVLLYLAVGNRPDAETIEQYDA